MHDSKKSSSSKKTKKIQHAPSPDCESSVHSSSPSLSAKYEDLLYATYQLIHHELVRLASLKLKNSLKDLKNILRTNCSIPRLLFDNYVKMDKKLCSSCLLRQSQCNMECTVCNVVTDAGLGGGEQVKYLIKSMEQAQQYLGEDIILRRFESVKTLSVMAPICEMVSDVEAYRKRGIVMKRCEDVSTIFFPIVKARISCGHENATDMSKNVVFPGIETSVICRLLTFAW